jgi:hypothetical protein
MTMTKDVVLSVLVVVHHLVLAIVMAVAPTIVMASVVAIAGLIANLSTRVKQVSKRVCQYLWHTLFKM